MQKVHIHYQILRMQLVLFENVRKQESGAKKVVKIKNSTKTDRINMKLKIIKRPI